MSCQQRLQCGGQCHGHLAPALAGQTEQLQNTRPRFTLIITALDVPYGFSSPLTHSSTLHNCSYPQSTMAQKYYMENSRHKSSFKLCASLSSVCDGILCRPTPSCSILPHPSQNVNRPFVQHLRAVLSPISDQQSQQCSACVQVTLILLNSGPKAQKY